MPSRAIDPPYRRMTVTEFLDLEIEGRAELDDGQLFMMAGGSVAHAAVTVNLTVALANRLRGSGCRPMSPDLCVKTGPDTVRMADVSVYCSPQITAEQGRAKLLGDPKAVFEVLSPSTRNHDQRTKLAEYQALGGCDLIVFVDPDAERVRVVERTGPEAWSDRWLDRGAEVVLAPLDVTMSADDVFTL